MSPARSERRGAEEVPAGWEAVIGLEVHVQLKTRSKLFSAAPNAFGAEPNTQTTEVDLGMPGVLPVLNRLAFECAGRTALALGCQVHPVSVFARKHYFYPDLPKGYQISQYEEPLATGGNVPVESNGQVRMIPLVRIHMEEDAGKSIHDEAITGGGRTHVDLNRAGVPLMEIVSEPEIRSAAEAGEYLRSLRSIVRYLGVSQGDMEKGHFRCDANISVRRAGETKLGTRVELKNLNSFRYVERAIAHEILRQTETLEESGEVVQETRRWDDRAGCTRVMRSKEYADDYRYFPDPDLVAVRLDADWIERARRELPELPLERRRRFERDLGLPTYDARVLTEDRGIADFVERTVELIGDAKTVSNWVMRDLFSVLNEKGKGLEETKLTAEHLAELLELLDQGKITPSTAREVLPELVDTGARAAEVVRARGLAAVTDVGELEALAREAIEANPAQAEQYRAGEEKLLNFFVGKVMKRTKGKANAAQVRETLAGLLKS